MKKNSVAKTYRFNRQTIERLDFLKKSYEVTTGTKISYTKLLEQIIFQEFKKKKEF